LKILREPFQKDDLLRAMRTTMNINTAKANIILSMMEIKDLIIDEAGIIRIR